MRTLFWVLLVLAGCKSENKETVATPRPVNAAVAARLEALGKSDTKENLEACLNVLRPANLFIAVKPNPTGAGGQAAIKLDEQRGHVLFAFLDEEAARAWWSARGGVTIQPTAATAVLDVAIFEQADLLVIEPQLPERSLVLTRDDFAPIAKAWRTPSPPDSGP